jgi:hypothetical protein
VSPSSPSPSRPVPILGEHWPGPGAWPGAAARADACWVPIARKLTPHGLRHTHRTVMEKLGTPPRLMDDRMGHEDGSVQARYTVPSTRARPCRRVRRFPCSTGSNARRRGPRSDRKISPDFSQTALGEAGGPVLRVGRPGLACSFAVWVAGFEPTAPSSRTARHSASWCSVRGHKCLCGPVWCGLAASVAVLRCGTRLAGCRSRSGLERGVGGKSGAVRWW